MYKYTYIYIYMYKLSKNYHIKVEWLYNIRQTTAMNEKTTVAAAAAAAAAPQPLL